MDLVPSDGLVGKISTEWELGADYNIHTSKREALALKQKRDLNHTSISVQLHIGLGSAPPL